MRKLIAALVIFLVTSSYSPIGNAQTTTQSFSEWGNFLVGGVWTSTHAQGHEHEQRWEWVLDRTFLEARWKASGDSGISFFGIDPSTGKLTWWGFDHRGRVWKGTTNLDKPVSGSTRGQATARRAPTPGRPRSPDWVPIEHGWTSVRTS